MLFMMFARPLFSRLAFLADTAVVTNAPLEAKQP
jgi:hypothetical protein